MLNLLRKAAVHAVVLLALGGDAMKLGMNLAGVTYYDIGVSDNFRSQCFIHTRMHTLKRTVSDQLCIE